MRLRHAAPILQRNCLEHVLPDSPSCFPSRSARSSQLYPGPSATISSLRASRSPWYDRRRRRQAAVRRRAVSGRRSRVEPSMLFSSWFVTATDTSGSCFYGRTCVSWCPASAAARLSRPVFLPFRTPAHLVQMAIFPGQRMPALRPLIPA